LTNPRPSKRVIVLAALALSAVGVVGAQSASAGCTTVYKDRVAASGGHGLVEHTKAYETCVV
jgi:hypothetical protein